MRAKIQLMLLITPLMLFTGCTPESKAAKVCCENQCFDVELATTPHDRSTGLMHRTELPKNTGMLFIYDKEAIYPFWMKNTLIPLDIIWINSDKEIVYMKKNAQPCEKDPCDTFRPDKRAKYVLELNAGSIDAMGWEIGYKWDFNIEGLQK